MLDIDSLHHALSIGLSKNPEHHVRQWLSDEYGWNIDEQDDIFHALSVRNNACKAEVENILCELSQKTQAFDIFFRGQSLYRLNVITERQRNLLKTVVVEEKKYGETGWHPIQNLIMI